MSTESAMPINVHAWEREEHEHYVEPFWCSKRLFEEEQFCGEIYDPCCGFGRVVEGARQFGLTAYGSDLVDRGFAGAKSNLEFLNAEIEDVDNIVCNPPFDITPKFAAKALRIARNKVAMIFPTARLNAARWLIDTPLSTVWLMTPRPPMPPGCTVKYGVDIYGNPQKVGGGKMDFCWLIWTRGHLGIAELRWLRRDKYK